MPVPPQNRGVRRGGISDSTKWVAGTTQGELFPTNRQLTLDEAEQTEPASSAPARSKPRKKSTIHRK